MCLTQKDKEMLLEMVGSSKNFEDLKLALQTFIVLETFSEEESEEINV